MSPKREIKIFLPKKIAQTGGTSTFARNFKTGMEKRGFKVCFSWQKDYDVLLASPTAPLRYLIHAKINKRPILHRLDGVYYPGSSAGWLWAILNLQLSVIRNIFASSIIYQSKYSQEACSKRLLPYQHKKPTSTIYNGVDTTIFSPKGTNKNLRDDPKQDIFISASRFRTKDQIIPLLNSFLIYQKKYNNNAKLLLIGPFEEQVTHIPKKYEGAPGVRFLGVVTHKELPTYLRTADIFLLTHKTPPCPNNILEALACGLPICGIADGAMPELVTNGVEGELVQESTRKTKEIAELLAQRLNIITKKQKEYSVHARKKALKEFTIETMLDKYASLIRNATQSK